MSQGGPVDITSQDGIEWRQEQRVVIARGNARAVRDGVTVTAARLLARYRPQAGAAPATARSRHGRRGHHESGGNEIFRLEAEQAVRIATATDVATGDRAVYDIDQAVLVLTGRELTLTTPNQRIVSRDSLEYWSQRRMAVARGNAVLTTNDCRYVGADTLVSYLTAEGTPAACAQQRARCGAAAAGLGPDRQDRALRPCRNPHRHRGHPWRPWRLFGADRTGPAAGQCPNHPWRQPGERDRSDW